MASSLTKVVHSQFANSMIDSGIDRPTVDKVATAVTEQLQQCYSPLSFLSTRYKIYKYLESHPLAVMPESVNYGPWLESHSGTTRCVYDTFQYVSVEKNVARLVDK